MVHSKSTKKADDAHAADQFTVRHLVILYVELDLEVCSFLISGNKKEIVLIYDLELPMELRLDYCYKCFFAYFIQWR